MKGRRTLVWALSVGLMLTLAAIYADEGCYCVDNFTNLKSFEYVVVLMYWAIFSGIVALLIAVVEELLRPSK